VSYRTLLLIAIAVVDYGTASVAIELQRST